MSVQKEKSSNKKKTESGFNVKDHYDEIKAFCGR